MSEVNVEVQIIKDIPVAKIQEYADLVVYGVARGTLDYTLRDSRFPFKTGNLQRSSIGTPPRKEGNYIYCLDVPEQAEYAEYVWQFPQNINWTNPNTYSQWFVAEYIEKKDTITKQAIDNAIRSVK